MERANLPPPVFRDEGGEAASVRAILYNNIRVRAQATDARILGLLGEEAVASLSGEERQILCYIAEKGHVTVSDIMELLGETRWHTTRVKLTRLVKKEALVFRSTKTRDPNARYELAPQK
jgi:DNA-binding MarR family transcriptional regulator